jgi:hypothetical protein
MTDQDADLLMAAAKAAGIEAGVIHQRPHRRCPEGWTPWNPLADDGDALRLAVQLKLSVWFEERDNHEWTHIVWVSPVFEPYVGDVDAATRRAIVRAAAAMGHAA